MKTDKRFLDELRDLLAFLGVREAPACLAVWRERLRVYGQPIPLGDLREVRDALTPLWETVGQMLAERGDRGPDGGVTPNGGGGSAESPTTVAQPRK